MRKSLEELKNEYIQSCDNQSGCFLQRDLEKIRAKAWDTAIKAVSDVESEALKFIKEKIEYHKQAYSLELFPNSKTIDDNSTKDSISAKMGRHMCNVFLGYINEALKEFRGLK